MGRAPTVRGRSRISSSAGLKADERLDREQKAYMDAPRGDDAPLRRVH
jgi:hypothetical protein